jgi:hypothetical protein
MWRRLYGALAWFPRLLGRIPGRRFYREAFCGNRFFFAAWAICSTVVTIALPVSILWEFHGYDDVGKNYALELIKIHPHLLLIPPMVLWAVLWVFGSAMSLAWKNVRGRSGPRKRMIGISLVAVAIALAFLIGELRSSPVMLLELSPRGPNQETWRTLYSEHRLMLDKPPASANDPQRANAQSALFKRVNYNELPATWKWSISWVFYAVTYFISIFAVANFYIGVAVAVDLKGINVRTRFLMLSVATGAAYTLWFPARFYYNIHIKGTLFGSTEATKGLDVVLWFGLALWAISILIANWSKFDKIKSVLGVVTTILVPLAGLVSTSMLGNLIGISSHPSQWAGMFLFLLATFYVYWRLLTSGNN